MNYLVGNWKLHKNKEEISTFFEGLGQFDANDKIHLGVAVSPTHLEFAKSKAPKGIEIYSQNVGFEKSGAWTGEISATQLLDIGIESTLVGHSERRQHFGETNETAAKRVLTALNSGLKVIFCVGESLEQREAGKTLDVLKDQTQPLIALLESKATEYFQTEQLVIAYEPVWAIGTGKTASPEIAEETQKSLSDYVSSHSCAPKILYGGSVKPSNFGELLGKPHIDGGLVGGASLEADSYLELKKCLTKG